MSITVLTKLSDEEARLFAEYKKRNNIDSNYKALKQILNRVFEEEIPAKEESFEDKVSDMSESELQKLFNKMADNDRKSTKLKRNGAWGPQIFFNDMKNLIKNKAPPMEIAYFAIQAHEKSVVINRMMEIGLEKKLKKRDRVNINWNEYHWRNPSLNLGDGNYIER